MVHKESVNGVVVVSRVCLLFVHVNSIEGSTLNFDISRFLLVCLWRKKQVAVLRMREEHDDAKMHSNKGWDGQSRVCL